MKLPTLIKIAGLTATLSVASFTARADTIIDTGAGGNESAWLLGPMDNGTQNLAAKFSVGGATTVTDVEGWLYTSFDGDLIVSITTDGGLIPGAVIFTSTINVLASSGIGWHGATGVNWNLAAGSYWATFEAGAGFDGGMLLGAPNPLGIEAASQGSYGNWFNVDYIDIGVRIQGNDGNSVPDQASSLFLFGLSLTGLVALRRRLN